MHKKSTRVMAIVLVGILVLSLLASLITPFL